MPGAVTFAPLEPGRIIREGAPEPSIRSVHEAVRADLDDAGYLSIQGQRGVWLWTGRWRVTFAASLGWDPIEIVVTTGHTRQAPLDLWAAVGYVPEGPSTQLVTLLVPASVADGDVLIRSGDHVDGVPQATFAGPAGPAGPEGPAGPAGEAGATGPAGPAGRDAPVPSTIQTTVSTVDTGNPATASFSGAWPNLTLALGLPRGVTGATGQPSPYMGVGQGRPDITSTLDSSGQSWVQAAPVGAMWCSTDGAGVGAWQWQRIGTGWEVVLVDTGWRSIKIRNVVDGGSMIAKRLNGAIYVVWESLTMSGSINQIVPGTANQFLKNGIKFNAICVNGSMTFYGNGYVDIVAGKNLSGTAVFPAPPVALMTTLPGTAA